MLARSIVLTGAPPPSTLEWDLAHLLQHLPPFIAPRDSSTHETPIQWRSLAPLANATDDASSRHEPNADFTGGNIDRYSGLILDTNEETLSEFYDYSFALHEGIGSFGQSESDSLNDSISFLDESVNDTSGYPSSHESVGKAPNPPAAVGHLSDLEDVPDAAYIQAVTPRIVTINLIVAIINVAPRRRVRTRWGREMDLVEVLVGDETRSGFRVTCWLPASDQGAPQTPLEQSLAGLRPRDIVLIRSVALSSFRDRVYGQSLRNNLTKIDLLGRRPVDSTDREGIFKWKLVVANTDNADRQLSKVRKVRQWLCNFVGSGVDTNNAASIPGDEETVRRLPPDTQ